MFIHICIDSSTSEVTLVYFSKTYYRTQLALNVNHESYAFIFGFNTFIALVMQSILTLVVADKRGLALEVRTQVPR